MIETIFICDCCNYRSNNINEFLEVLDHVVDQSKLYCRKCISIGQTPLLNETIHKYFDDNKPCKSMFNISKEELAKKLTPFYKDNRLVIAKLCDEIFDRTGELLGIVRNIARGEQNAL